MNKLEYIKNLKQLIKKYHPDLNNNSYLESVYNEITKILVNKLNEAKTNKNFKPEINKEQDYVYYKLGVKYYKNIHPDKFYKRNTDSTYETKTYDEQITVLNKIYLSFNLSEYFFNKIVEEYPASSYFDDAKAKILLLKKLYKSYENINIENNTQIIDNNKFIKEMDLKLFLKN